MKNLARSKAFWENDGAGGGGGGGEGGGEGSFTEAQRAELNTMINSANSTHSTRMQKVMDQKLEGVTSNINSKFDELIGKLGGDNSSGGNNSKGQGGGQGGAGGNQGGEGESDAMRQMRREHEARMAEMDRKFAEEKNLREATDKKAKTQEERSKLRQALADNEVPAGLMRAAEALLYVEDKRIGRAKDSNGKPTGEIHFLFQRDGYVDKMTDLKKAVGEWLTTAEGKHYAPARQVKGSGNQGNRNQGSNNNGKMSRAQEKQQAKRELMHAILSEGSFQR
jgi:hypothetical protein